MLIRKLTEADVTFIVTIEEEDRSPRQHFMEECGWKDDAENFLDAEQTVSEREERLAGGDLWAFGCVKVTARWKSWSDFTTLGCCSYQNEEEFKGDGYYESMKADALANLNQVLAAATAELSELESHPDVW